MSVGSQPGCADGLVRPFTAGSHIKIGTDERFAKDRHVAGADGQADGKTADDCDDRFAHKTASLCVVILLYKGTKVFKNVQTQSGSVTRVT